MIFKIPVTWEYFGVVEIEAENIDKAIKIADDDIDGIPLPEGEYVDGSWKVNKDSALIKVLNNDNKQEINCNHSFVDSDNEGYYGKEKCRFCGKIRDK